MHMHAAWSLSHRLGRRGWASTGLVLISPSRGACLLLRWVSDRGDTDCRSAVRRGPLSILLLLVLLVLVLLLRRGRLIVAHRCRRRFWEWSN